ncbi:MAG: low molecular weight phosphotyrosine protein phosphatase [Gloeobacteraceae cyanobacterium ES-bin-316]|nr:low molecular weight phosphotyrosine protein phosphatase [Ferruginibacter sp.]
MVCLGNICRSPLAEGILKMKANAAGLPWVIDSAGTNGFHVGEAPHHLSQKVAKANGLDICGQVARKFSRRDIEEYDIIYAMAGDVMNDIHKIAGPGLVETKVKLFLDELYPNQSMDVPDPWYGDEDGYHDVYALIEQTCDRIVEKYLITSKQQQV